MKSFLHIKTKMQTVGKGSDKETICVIYPSFNMSGKDIMLRGGKFYAVCDLKTGMWSQDESDVWQIVDRELYYYKIKNFKQDGYGVWRSKGGYEVSILSMGNDETGQYRMFNRWVKALPPNFNYIPLDTSITFNDEKVKPEDYRSKRLGYPIQKGSIESYQTLMSKLYSSSELEKIEWSIGSVFTGYSKVNDKLLVLYGNPGSGKSTLLDLLKDLFYPYWVPFSAAGIAQKTDQFATSMFSNNPLVAIQDDGSLAKIDSPVINEIISHKDMIVNEKGVQRYHIKPLAMLFLATNETVDIHDTKLGISRRLLDVYPTGQKFPIKTYRKLVAGMKFEHGAIAQHCIDVFNKLGEDYYSDYEPRKMIDKTNYLRNFLFDISDDIEGSEWHTRNELYARYKQYCEESGLGYPPKRLIFGEQLKDYFEEYYPIKNIDGKTVRHVYGGFRGLGNSDLLEVKEEPKTKNDPDWLKFKPQESRFDEIFKDCPAQYDTGDDSHPLQYSWKNCKTRLSDLDTKKLHYVNVPDSYNLIFIDFDIKNKDGKKDPKANLEAASEWPKTYGEFSKSGAGIHLYYFYSGDVDKLQSHYTPDIEIKITKGKRPIRRISTKCNSEDISTISSGLPVKGDKKKVISDDVIRTNRGLHTFIQRCLKKEHHGHTAPEVSFIYSKLEESYNAGVKYDVSDMYEDIRNFAMGSTNQSDKCMDLVRQMHFKSDDPADQIPDTPKSRIAFFDVEVFPNLFIFCYKFQGTPSTKASVLKLINPTASEIAGLFKSGKDAIQFIGFNNRRYDNHICWARIMGYSDEHLYDLSQKIINGEHNAFFQDAYNISYTDIYDYSSTKQSLKKWEIQLDIHHQENHYPWDQLIDESHWAEIADYCANDVLATEAVFDATQEDFMAREILATAANKLCPSQKSTVNDTTNQLTTRIIFRGVKNPQEQFVYTDLSKEFPGYSYERGADGKMHNMYRGEDVGFGGYVFATPGMYGDAALLDIASMHPHSIKALNLFGPFTKNFTELMDTRIAVKHKEWDKAKTMLDGALKDYIPDKFESADEEKALSKKLAKALKIAINSVYGLTSAKFSNPFKDPRNVNNIVALRGALFMVNLKHEVMDRGYTVAHIKTDSIKIPWADQKIIDFVTEYGKKYGYDFEHEATFDRVCLINDSTYICKVKEGDENGAGPGEWSGTGTEFNKKANPYIFKTLFSHEDLEFSDVCETKSVKSAMYLDFNEYLDDVTEFEKLKKLRGYSGTNHKFTKSEQKLLDEYKDISDSDLDKEIAKGHNYYFIGKVGLFTPVVEGANGGLLVREQNGQFYSVTGAKDYRWMESAQVKELKYEPKIDYSYYDELAEEAKKDIQQFGDFDLFVSDKPIPKPMKDPMKEDIDPSKPLLDINDDDLPF